MTRRNRIIALLLAIVMTVAGSFTAWAAKIVHEYSKPEAPRDPEYKVVSEENNNPMGAGEVYSDQHPEVTDPEFLIKKYYCYPGEPQYQKVEPEYLPYAESEMKVMYENPNYPVANMTEALPLLQKFVHSFDWIHSDERTRYEEVYRTIGRLYNGNYYDDIAGYQRCNEKFLVLRTKGGICEQFSTEFAELCKIVGLECVTYLPSQSHQDCLVKVDGQWFAVDPTNETLESHRAVDYDAEYNRSAREWAASPERQEEARRSELYNQLLAGEITATEMWRLVYPGKTDAEIEQILGETLEEYEAKLARNRSLYGF